MKARRLVLTAVALMFGATAFADEGMWMIQDINEALEKNMRARGLKLAGWVANAIDPDMARYADNLACLTERLPAPLLLEIPHGS